MRRAATAFILALAMAPVPALAGCLSDAEIDAAVGDQVRAGAAFVSAPTLADRTLCSGLTLAQAIQRLHAAAFPEERVRAAAQHEELVADDEALAADRAAYDQTAAADTYLADRNAVDAATESAVDQATEDAMNQSAAGVIADPTPRAPKHRRASAKKKR
jgi:hypothetical protein